jgi:hypothetical protein
MRPPQTTWMIHEEVKHAHGHPTDKGCCVITRHKFCEAYRGRRIRLPVVIADRRPPGWLATQRRVESWRLLGASEFLRLAVQLGIVEKPSILFSSDEIMNPMPQTPEDLAFGREDLRAGCQEGIHEEVKTGEAERIRGTGVMILSSFVVW